MSNCDWFNSLWLHDSDDTALAPVETTAFTPLNQPGASTGLSESPWKPNNTGVYPVLGPILPHLNHIMSPALSCHLLEAFLADSAEGAYVPSSPLLLTHIFKREALLSQDTPRTCSPALLASMLLVSAFTTEFPFFGGSPSYRKKLCEQLLQLTLTFLGHAACKKSVQDRDGSVELPGAIGPTASSLTGLNHPIRRVESSKVDEVVAYMHVGLVTMSLESKPPGSHWWQVAFRKAKEYKLNSATRNANMDERFTQINLAESRRGDHCSEHGRSNLDHGADETDSASPLTVDNNMVMESSRPSVLRPDLEERQAEHRVWWTLYIWDKHLALRYNQPLSLTDSECQHVPFPVDDMTGLEAAHGQYRPISKSLGLPRDIVSCGIFEVLVPIMSVLGLIMCMHHSMRACNGDQGESNGIKSAYTTIIVGRLSLLEASITSISSGISENPAKDNGLAHQQRSHAKHMAAYAIFLLHLCRCLVDHPLDRLMLLDYLGSSHTNLSDIKGHSLLAASSINDVMALDSDLGFKNFFFGLFLFHGSALPWALAHTAKDLADDEVITACKTYIRVFEIVNATNEAEYLRKARRLLLQALKEAQGGDLSAIEQHLRNRILCLYRWTGDGLGLGL